MALLLVRTAGEQSSASGTARARVRRSDSDLRDRRGRGAGEIAQTLDSPAAAQQRERGKTRDAEPDQDPLQRLDAHDLDELARLRERRERVEVAVHEAVDEDGAVGAEKGSGGRPAQPDRRREREAAGP